MKPLILATTLVAILVSGCADLRDRFDRVAHAGGSAPSTQAVDANSPYPYNSPYGD